MEKTRKCPYCGEEIMADAKKCRHCGEWLNDEAEPKQEPEKQPIKESIPVKPTHNNERAKSNKTLIVIIAIAAVAVLVVGGLLLFGSSDSKSEDSAIVENSVEKELEALVLESYKTHEIYNLQTLDFKAAEEAAIAADVPGYASCIDWDFFYATQEDPDHTRATNARAEIVDENKAHVYVTLENELESEPTTLILIMIRDDLRGKWLVDDVRTTGKFEGSIKELMYKCANESGGYDDYEVDEEAVADYEVAREAATGVEMPQTTDNDQTAIEENRFVVIDGSELRLRMGPSTSSETYKWPDGTNRHPNVGDKFRYLGESGDFYKIAFDSKEMWVSKQYTHLESGSQVVTNDRLEIESEQENGYEAEENVDDQEIFQIVEEMPSYPGGEGKLMEYVANNIKYPQIARETGIQGRVFVGLVVEPDGSISNVKVLRGIGGGCDEEAVRIVENMPKWKPGKQRGKTVRVSYMLPINFKIQ